MSTDVKICGLQEPDSLAAAVSCGARYVGFVLCPNSRHRVNASTVAALLSRVPDHVTPVGLFVDPSDDDLASLLKTAPLRMIQLHGHETPQRVASIRQTTQLPVIKATGVSSVADIEQARRYETVADMLLFDAKPRPDGPNGGNGIAFNWSLLKGQRFAKPWMLAGGLNAATVAEAISMTGARIVDVSSGVEDATGLKNPAKIKAFIEAAQK